MTNITFPLSEANVAQCMAERDAEIEWLQEYKRKQMADIMDLGQQVGKLEIENERLRALHSAADQTVKDLIEHSNQREAKIEQLRAALDAERERCAKIAEAWGRETGVREIGYWIAAAIKKGKA